MRVYNEIPLPNMAKVLELLANMIRQRGRYNIRRYGRAFLYVTREAF